VKWLQLFSKVFVNHVNLIVWMDVLNNGFIQVKSVLLSVIKKMKLLLIMLIFLFVYVMLIILETKIGNVKNAKKDVKNVTIKINVSFVKKNTFYK